MTKKKQSKLSQSTTASRKNATSKTSNSYKQKTPTLDRVKKQSNFDFTTSYKAMTKQRHKQKIKGLNLTKKPKDGIILK